MLRHTYKSPAALPPPQGTAGLSFGVPEKKMGWNAQPTTAVMFDDVRVPADSMVGQVRSRAARLWS